MAEKDKKKVPKNNPPPKPWYLGWGLAKFAASTKTKVQKQKEKALADLKKE